MKNKDIFTLRETLNEVDYVKGKAFAYAVFKNKEIFDKEIEIFNKLKKDPHPDYYNFENDRTLLCQIHSEKDENDQPIIAHNPDGSQSYKIIDLDKFNAEFADLSTKYKEVIDDMNNSKKEIEEFLNSESEVEIKKIEVSQLPDDITATFLNKIKFMLID